MKKLTYFALALVSISLFSCGSKSEADLNAEVDSLRTALTQRDADYQQLDEFLAVVSTGLDSIAMQENALFNPGKESPVPNQATIKAQLAQFKETLKTQRERITELEKQLKEGKGNAKQMQLIITTLKAQMEEREKQITALQEELKDKNITIDGLRKHMTALTQQNVSQQAVITSQNEVIADQDTELNKGFIIIATKSELKEAGLLEGGFMKKAKLNVKNIDESMAKIIDIRDCKEITINSKNPKVLTQIPSDSYTIEKADKNSVLRITNAARFWSVSRYLVIQAN
jgi:chromosome segregation ATPase